MPRTGRNVGLGDEPEDGEGDGGDVVGDGGAEVVGDGGDDVTGVRGVDVVGGLGDADLFFLSSAMGSLLHSWVTEIDWI